MKQKLLLKSLVLLFALIAGSMNVWAVDVVHYTLDGTTTGGSNGYATESDITQSGISWKVTGNTTMNPWRIGGSSLDGVDRPAYSVTAMNSAITKVELSVGAASSITVNSVKLLVYDNSGFIDNGIDKHKLDEVTTSFTANTTLTFSPTSGTEWATGSFYKIIFNVTVSGTSNKFVEFKNAKFYKTNTGGGVDAPTFSPGEGAIAAGSTVTLSHADADQIRYTTDNTDPTKTTGTVYSMPITITTPTTIKAIAIKGDDVSAVATAAYTISVEDPTFSPESGSYMVGTTITLTSAGNTIYYNLTTDGSNPADPNNTSTEYTAPIVLGSGTTKIKAVAHDTYGNASSFVTRSYKGKTPTSLPFSWTGTSSAGKDDLEGKTGVVVNLGSDYKGSNAPYILKFDGEGKNVTIYTDAKPECVYFTAKLFNAANTGSKIKVQGSADGITFTDIEEFTIKGAANATFEFTTSNAFDASHRAVKLVMSSKDQNVAVGTITVAPASVPAAINPTYKWATYSSTIPLDFSGTGVSAYIVTGFEGSAVTKTQVNKVPANTGLLLNGTTDNIPLATGDLDDVSANKMVAVTTATTISKVDGKTRYVLADEGGKAMFLSINATAANIPAGKAYLEIDGDGARELYFDDTTAINALENATKVDNGAIYDLSGRRVENPTKGIYIINGKKVIFK